MTWAEPLGYCRVDQKLLLRILDRAIDAVVHGADSEHQAVAAILYWLAYGEQSGRIEIDFPRTHELMAVCVVEAFRRYLRHNNASIFARASQSGAGKLEPTRDVPDRVTEARAS